jgi:pimeloyl-ACP methyl ester carboxylesterase
MGVAMALPAGLNTIWAYTPGVAQMREVIGLFADDRGLITDELIEMRYRGQPQPAGPRFMAGPAGAWRRRPRGSLARLIRPAHRPAPGRPTARASGCGHWTMIEKTAEFLAVVRPFLA